MGRGGNERLIKRFNGQMSAILRCQKELEEINENLEEKENEHKTLELTDQEKTERFLREAAEELNEDEFSVSTQAATIKIAKKIDQKLIHMPLPWDAHASKFLAAREKKMQEVEELRLEKKRVRKERDEARTRGEIYRQEFTRLKNQFEKKYRMKFEKKENAREKRRRVEAEKIIIQVQGKQVNMATLTQGHVDIMTAEEFRHYTKISRNWNNNN